MTRILSSLRHGMFALGLMGIMASPAQAVTIINELFINPPGSDNGQEFFELSGTPGESLNGLFFLSIDGDATSAGTIDQAISLNGFSLGTNGLFLQRDSAAVINPSPDPATTVRVLDFNPDLENGSNTFLLVQGFTGAVGNDLDTNNDGILDVVFPGTVIDAVAIVENDGAQNFGYATAFGGVQNVQAAFSPDAFVRGSAIFADVTGTNPGGPYTLDPSATILADGTDASTLLPLGATLTPGSINPQAIPFGIPAGVEWLALGTLIGCWQMKRRSGLANQVRVDQEESIEG